MVIIYWISFEIGVGFTAKDCLRESDERSVQFVRNLVFIRVSQGHSSYSMSSNN